jgi:hypothetical protein
MAEKGMVIGIWEKNEELDHAAAPQAEESNQGIVGRARWWWWSKR